MNESATRWWLLLQTEFSQRKLLVLVCGQVLGLLFQFSLLWWVASLALLCLAHSASARLILALGLLFGAVWVSPFQAPRSDFEGDFMVRAVSSRGAVFGSAGRSVFIPRVLMPTSVEVGDEVHLASDHRLSGNLTTKPETFVVRGPAGSERSVRWLDSVWSRSVSEPDRRLLQAFTLGSSASLSREDRRSVQETGAGVFFSSSGLHVYVLAGALWLLSLAVPAPRLLRVILCALLLCGFAVATGGHPGTWRAIVFCAMRWLAPHLRREFDGLSALALVCGVDLLVEPASIWDAGFVFGSVAVLGWYLCPWGLPAADARPGVWEWMRGLLVRSGWMFLVTWPLSACFYGSFSFAGLLLNPLYVLLVPVVAAMVGAGTVLSLLGANLGGTVLHASSEMIRIFLSYVHSLTSLSLTIATDAPWLPYIAAIYFISLVRLYMPSGRRSAAS